MCVESCLDDMRLCLLSSDSVLIFLHELHLSPGVRAHSPTMCHAHGYSAHAHTHTHRHTHKRTHIHTRTHTHTHKRTHIQRERERERETHSYIPSYAYV